MGLPQKTATKLHRTLHWPQNVSESTIPAVQQVVLAQEGFCSYLHPGATCSSSRGGSMGIFLGCSMLPHRECHFLNGMVEQEIWHCSLSPHPSSYHPPPLPLDLPSSHLQASRGAVLARRVPRDCKRDVSKAFPSYFSFFFFLHFF